MWLTWIEWAFKAIVLGLVVYTIFLEKRMKKVEKEVFDDPHVEGEWGD